MNVAVKWRIAALTMVTWPVAFWLMAPNPSSLASRLLLALASLPLFIGVGMELYAQWKQEERKPGSSVEGSPLGNKIAVLLAIALIGVVLCLVFSASHRT